MDGSKQSESGRSELEQEIYDRLGPVFEKERARMAKALAEGPDSELLGRKEFEIRDQVHELGAQALEAAADERQKRGRVRRS